MNQEKSGLGAGGSTEEAGDDPFESYRKRMMLGYKHRPNPRKPCHVFCVHKLGSGVHVSCKRICSN
jgi:hypothetical protein